MKLVSKKIEEYCVNQSLSDNKLLKALSKKTWEKEKIPEMLSGPLVSGLLHFLIKISGAKRVLEIGMFTGYSTLKIAEALPVDGEVHSCELMEKHVNTARSFFDRSEFGNKITIHEGPALDSLEQLHSSNFDMAFIDADKSNYLDYYKRCFTLIRCGGVIILDNMLWSGTVIDPKDDDSKMLRKTGDYIQNDDRVFNTLLSIRDGLMLCIKK